MFLTMPCCLSLLMPIYIALILINLNFSNSQLQAVEWQQQSITENHNMTISPFLRKLKGGQISQSRARLQEQDCWLRPWICREGLRPFEPIFCCRKRCINVSSDPDNCGFCGIRCPFGWTCCHGLCVDTMINPFHCGDCNRRCKFPHPCVYGLCGYAEIFPRPHPHPKPHPKFPEPPFPPAEGRDNATLDFHKE